jgi:hypothetical protein
MKLRRRAEPSPDTIVVNGLTKQAPDVLKAPAIEDGKSAVRPLRQRAWRPPSPDYSAYEADVA